MLGVGNDHQPPQVLDKRCKGSCCDFGTCERRSSPPHEKSVAGRLLLAGLVGTTHETGSGRATSPGGKLWPAGKVSFLGVHVLSQVGASRKYFRFLFRKLLASGASLVHL